ncbi:NirD/YgiW/YdeI family stress tolerance protein [uncultured Acinetobacter sp.]|uniref:NirD/YgiW/YdeI family stress tolerance protein n=1 Tax=uncultured Acinetobacter sp. TaxID=165433 RepID=UPI0025FC81FA|nr:NirD/YgiW/YdeI family stress tolerance protein [uncultured Acinetobacter sp.]
MRKTPLLLSVVVSMLTSHVLAEQDDHGFLEEAAKNNITIVQALRANDETAITLQGEIVRLIKHEHYELKDTTGSMTIEVDDELATAEQLKAGTVVKVAGEIDTHRYKPTDIEVVKIEIIKP